jgi:hypothetical protein
MKKNILLISLVVLGFALVSCNKNEKATLNIRLTDAPADYDAVKVDVQKVLINAGDDENNGWIELETTPGIYNLLDYTAGNSTLIATAPLDISQIKQIRLVLGENNSVVIDGVDYLLDTPSAQQSGLKLKVNQTLNEGVIYTAILDFDASKSVISAGQSGKYILKPVIRMYFEANTGSIKGSVEPAAERVLVEVPLSSTDTISTYSDVTNGVFLSPGVPAGTYDVFISTGTGSIYKGTTISDVIVITGETTLLDKIVLENR